MLAAHELVRRRAQRRQLFVEPRQRGGRARILLAQALDEPHGKGDRQVGGLDPLEGQGTGRLSTEPEQLVGEGVGVMAGGAALHDALGQAPEILHEHHPQGDRDRPEFADRQRLHALVGTYEAVERLGLEAAIRVRDEVPGESEHAWVALKRPFGELGQLAVEPGREIFADLAHDVVDDVEVVDEPLRGGSDRALLTNHAGERSIALEQDAAALPQAR